jgi:hypothetical protein
VFAGLILLYELLSIDHLIANRRRSNQNPSEELFDTGRKLRIIVRHEVSVHAKSNVDGRMTQSPRNCFDAVAGSDQMACVCMAKIVKPSTVGDQIRLGIPFRSKFLTCRIRLPHDVLERSKHVFLIEMPSRSRTGGKCMWGGRKKTIGSRIPTKSKQR